MSTTDYSTPKEVEALVKESKTKILASLTLSGIKNEDAAKQLNISVYAVRKIQESDAFKSELRSLTDDMVKTAATTWKGSMNRLIPKALAALEKGLEAGKLDAVKLVMTTLAVDKHETGQTQDAVVQVVLPNYQPKDEKNVDIEVKKG